MIELDSVERLPLRDVFQKEGEARGFTPWLSRNLHRLSDLLSIEIGSAETEVVLDSLRVDIVASAGLEEESKVVIENQFETSDSAHLGKLLSYAAYTGAKYAVWIVESAREEHIRAIEMLNRVSSECYFFLVRAEVFKIGDSKPAIVLSTIIGPANDYGQLTRDGFTQTQQTLMNFWSGFLERAKEKKLDINYYQPPRDRWYHILTGRSNLFYSLFVRKNSFSVSLIINSGEPAKNKRDFDELEIGRSKVEDSYGADEIQWRRMSDKKSSKIEVLHDKYGGYTSEEHYNQIYDDMIDVYLRLSSALAPFIGKLEKPLRE